MMKRLFVHLFYSLVLLTGCAKSNQPEGALTPQQRTEMAAEREKDEAAAKAAGYFELPAAENPQEIIYHLAYSLKYSETHEQAEWVAYMLTANRTSNTYKRKNDFRTDPKVPTGSATHADYKGSGYHRGHLAPSADMGWSPEVQSESFYYSNMSPQVPACNTGIWSKLEKQVRDWAVEYDTILVVTGPLLTDGLPGIGPNEVAVPEFYYKVILHNDLTAPKGIGFIVPNAGSKAHVSAFAVPIDSVEAVTGIDFFPLLPATLEEIEGKICMPCWKWNSPDGVNFRAE